MGECPNQVSHIHNGEGRAKMDARQGDTPSINDRKSGIWLRIVPETSQKVGMWMWPR